MRHFLIYSLVLGLSVRTYRTVCFWDMLLQEIVHAIYYAIREEYQPGTVEDMPDYIEWDIWESTRSGQLSRIAFNI